MMDIYEKYVGLVFDGRYRIQQVIGVGGMAVVFKADDMLMRRTVAVKILKDEISTDEQSVRRFINESKAVSMLSHQNIVSIYDVSVRANVKYIVMEFVEGITLKSYMEHRGVLNLREIISYTTQILRALDHAHSKGIVHRDIKPQNIMLLKNGIIKVMDFGIAKLPNTETLSGTNQAVGTVFYISPEQASGKEIDSRSDIYSLGNMMYEMATGKLPFTADTPVSVALKQINDKPVPPRELNEHIPAGLEQIILRAMEKDPDDRYQCASEMLEQLLVLKENPKTVFKDTKAAKAKAKAKEKERERAASTQEKHKTSRTMFPIIMGVTIAFLLVAGIAGYYILDKVFLNSAMNNYENITVENFTGTVYSEELSKWLADSTYYAVPDITYVYSNTIEKGIIISQEPGANEIRKVLPGVQKCALEFEVSLGERKIVLEDYTIRDYRIVESELRKTGLKVKTENVANDIYEIGYVISTSPEAGSVLRENDTVLLYVSAGCETEKTSVPDFYGLSEAETYIVLTENRLKAGTITYMKTWQDGGTVVKQSVDAYEEVPQYSAIDFTISGGPNYSGDGTTLPKKNDMEWWVPETEAETTEPEQTDDVTDQTVVDDWWTDPGTSSWSDDTSEDTDSSVETDAYGGYWEDDTQKDKYGGTWEDNSTWEDYSSWSSGEDSDSYDDDDWANFY